MTSITAVLTDHAAKVKAYPALLAERDALRAQRDELAAALRAVLEDTDSYDGKVTEKWASVKRARAALAKVTP